jgi:hypothetical protein
LAVDPGGAGLHVRDIGQRNVCFKDLLGDHDPQLGIELGRQTGQQRRLARARRSGHEHGQARSHARPQKRGHGRIEHVEVDQLAQLPDLHARELADVDQHMTVAADVAVHDVQPGARVELGVLETLGRIELAVRTARIVEDLGQDPPDMVVIVEDLVVIAGQSLVAPHEDRQGSVHHDLPHVGVVQQRLQRPVAGQIAQSPLRHHIGLDDVGVPPAPLIFPPPTRNLFVDKAGQHGRRIRRRHVDRHQLGPVLDGPLYLHQRRHPAVGHRFHAASKLSSPFRRRRRRGHSPESDKISDDGR